jgi:hypothetical protein
MAAKHALAATLSLILVGHAHAHDFSETAVWECEIRQALKPGDNGNYEDSGLLELTEAAGREAKFTFDPVSGIVRLPFWNIHTKMDVVQKGSSVNSLIGLSAFQGTARYVVWYLAIQTFSEPHIGVLMADYQSIYSGLCSQP